MRNLLLFGATGNLGKEIAREASLQGYNLTIAIRNREKAEELKEVAPHYIIVDVTNRTALENICNGYDIVISSLGKSVSPNEHSKPSFTDIDLVANTNILDVARKSAVKKFVYISAFQAEKFPHLEYFSVHHEFAKRLIASGIDYSIIKPPAIFSGYLDMIDMARKGRLVNIGSGDKKTNPIYEGDLAKECIKAIDNTNSIIEIGGQSIYTRRQLYQIIQNEVNPSKKVINFPLWLFKLSLPIIKLFNRNLYAKFAFFVTVLQEDTIAPQVGSMSFEEYINMKSNALYPK